MISLEQAFQIVINTAKLIEPERVSIENALGRVLSEDIFSDIDMPPFDKAAMDGYACRAEDIFNELEVMEVIPAGKIPEKEITKNTCAKIMTGAPIPKGTEIVIIVEDTEILPSGKIRYTKPQPIPDSCSLDSSTSVSDNICRTGEDIQKDSLLLKKGTILKSAHIAVMASAGNVRPLVSKKVKVGVIATGSELVEPGEKPGISQIRNSNGFQMTAQLAEIHAEAHYYGIAPDNEESTYQLLKKATDENDVVLLSGGVSMGDFDFVPKIFNQLEFNILFDRIAVQPGKPTTFAVRGTKYCFGMPGNPVSSFVQFELLVKPFLYKLCGADFRPANIKMPLAETFTRKRANRQSWIPVVFTSDGKVSVSEYHGSAHINGLDDADGLISVPINVYQIKEGEIVHVRQI
jgi:molybdopterin molybdotransferase